MLLASSATFVLVASACLVSSARQAQNVRTVYRDEGLQPQFLISLDDFLDMFTPAASSSTLKRWRGNLHRCDQDSASESDKKDGVLFPMSYGTVNVLCTDFTHVENGASRVLKEIGVIVDPFGPTFSPRLPNVDLGAVDMTVHNFLHSVSSPEVLARRHFGVLRQASRGLVKVQEVDAAIRYFARHSVGAEGVHKVLSQMMTDLVQAHVNAFMDLDEELERKGKSESTPRPVSIKTLLKRYCKDSPAGPLRRSKSLGQCLRDTLDVYALYSFAFTFVGELAQAEVQVCNSEEQVKWASTGSCGSGASSSSQPQCWDGEDRFCVVPDAVYGESVLRRSSCCCAKRFIADHTKWYSFGKVWKGTDGCFTDRLNVTGRLVKS